METNSLNDTLISSTELLKKAGISRATLNNYIKMGIIPKPVVKKPANPALRAKKIGYFPQASIERIETVKQMKEDGMVMEEVIREFKEPAHGLSVKSDTDEHTFTPARSSLDENNEIKLTINSINCPAYLINNNFEIDWINEEAEELIFNRKIRSILNAEDRNIFKLFLSRCLTGPDKEESRDELAEFHMAFLKSKYPSQLLPSLFPGFSNMEIEALKKIYDGSPSMPKDTIQETYLKIIYSDKAPASYRAYSMIFREGILHLFTPVDSMLQNVADLLSSRGKVINDLLKQRMPTLVSFCVLVADLQGSSRICAELPPEEYFELIRGMWKLAENSFKKYYGTYGKHVGDGMVYYFIKDKNSDYIINSISCALEIRENMNKFSAEWKVRKGWFNDLCLNIGINEGQEYFGSIPTAPNLEFTALGDSVNYAGRLSDFARYGAIWTTKNLMIKLKEEERKKIRFGIRHKDHTPEGFIENMFSRIMDMLQPGDPYYSKFMDIATLPVTEIINKV